MRVFGPELIGGLNTRMSCRVQLGDIFGRIRRKELILHLLRRLHVPTTGSTELCRPICRAED